MNVNAPQFRFPWVLTGTKAILFVLKNRIKAPRVTPAPSTGDPATDDATRREFERVKSQLDADYQDDRALLEDLEPLLTELAQHLQGWMYQRDEMFSNVMFGNPRGQLALPASGTTSGSFGTPVAPQDPASNVSQYEGLLIKAPDADPIYKIENGRKRWIISPEVFFRLGYKAHSEIVVPRAVVDAIPFGQNLT